MADIGARGEGTIHQPGAVNQASRSSSLQTAEANVDAESTGAPARDVATMPNRVRPEETLGAGRERHEPSTTAQAAPPPLRGGDASEAQGFHDVEGGEGPAESSAAAEEVGGRGGGGTMHTEQQHQQQQDVQQQQQQQQQQQAMGAATSGAGASALGGADGRARPTTRPHLRKSSESSGGASPGGSSRDYPRGSSASESRVTPATDDIDPVTKKELWGWVAYDWANSVYASVAIGVLLPLLIVTLAEERAGGPPPGVVEVAINPAAAQDEDPFVYFMGAKVSPTSVTLYFVSVSVVLQAIVFITMGAAADHGELRKKLLLITSYAGAFVTALCLPLGGEDSMWWVVGLITIVSNVLYGASIVFYNAFLPLLVAAHPDVLEVRAKTPEATTEEINETEDRISNFISTRGFAAGYASGLLCLIIVIGIVLAMGTDSTLSVRLCLFLSGVWWAANTVITSRWLKPRPGPPLPEGSSYLTHGWKQFIVTLRRARKMPDTFVFLCCFFAFSDGANTISVVGILFAREELGLGTSALLIVALLVPLFAFAGNYLYFYIQQKLGWTSKKTLVVILVMLGLIPAYAFIGFWAPFGLVQPNEIWIFAAFFGLHIGAVQSFARVIFSELIPVGHEANFFSLYEITDKGSSWIGPLGVAALRDATGSVRWGIVYLAIMLLGPIPAILWVDVPRGKALAKKVDAIVPFDEEHPEGADSQRLESEVHPAAVPIPGVQAPAT